MLTFERFFSTAFGNDVCPFAYQQALAKRPWPDALIAPTGLGKTAAVVLGWAWKHAVVESPTPRRLVYCLPMRTLVEQTERNAREWLRELGKENTDWKSRLPDPETGVHVLMGGMDEPRWFESPEYPAILIGTQDMLISRALMRRKNSIVSWNGPPLDFVRCGCDALRRRGTDNSQHKYEIKART